MLLGRCGHRNDNSVVDPEGREDASGRELAASCASLSGRIAWQDEASSNSGAEIWLLDHTLGAVIQRPIRPDGFYRFECGLFAEKSVLSLHLVKDQRLIADFDFSDVQPGIQGAFSYAGGVGHDLGKAVVPRNLRGEIGFLPQGLSARIGGGFRVNPEIAIDLNEFGESFSPLRMTAASQLIIGSPNSILQSFYLADENMAAYRRDLTTFSRVRFRVSTSETGFIRRVNLLGESSWLRFARVPKGDDSGPASEYWSDKQLELRQNENGDLYSIDVFLGFIPKLGDMGFFQVYKSAGSLLSIPRLVDQVVLFPPMVTAFGAGVGAGVSTIDYREQSQKNGLTRPFCDSGDIRFSLQPPRNGLPGSPGVTYLAEGPSARIVVRMEYYAEISGNSPSIESIPEDYSVAFRQAHTQTVDGSVKRTWHPNAQELTFFADNGLYGEKTITIPRGVLPDRVGGQNVSLTKLRIFWEDVKSSTGGGTALWLKKLCSK
jgi:hypothetical protein